MTSVECWLAEELLSLQRGALSPEQEEHAHAHLDHCEACRALFYELDEPHEPGAREPSEAELAAFEARLQARATRYLQSCVIPFSQPTAEITRLVAHGSSSGDLALRVAPNEGAQLLQTEELEIRVVERQEGAGTLVLLAVTLSPSSPHAFTVATDVRVHDGDERVLEPLAVRVRPLVWTATFGGAGVFIVRARGAEVCFEVQRPA